MTGGIIQTPISHYRIATGRAGYGSPATWYSTLWHSLSACIFASGVRSTPQLWSHCLKFPTYLANACGLDPEQLYRICKYLYGLPDAGRIYFLKYSKVLIDNGYSQAKSDPCLFIRIDKEKGSRTTDFGLDLRRRLVLGYNSSRRTGSIQRYELWHGTMMSRHT